MIIPPFPSSPLSFILAFVLFSALYVYRRATSKNDVLSLLCPVSCLPLYVPQIWSVPSNPLAQGKLALGARIGGL